MKSVMGMRRFHEGIVAVSHLKLLQVYSVKYCAIVKLSALEQD